MLQFSDFGDIIIPTKISFVAQSLSLLRKGILEVHVCILAETCGKVGLPHLGSLSRENIS